MAILVPSYRRGIPHFVRDRDGHATLAMTNMGFREIMMKRREKNIDEHYMRLAIAEAQKGVGLTSPNPAVGCVIVKNGVILGKGHHRRA